MSKTKVFKPLFLNKNEDIDKQDIADLEKCGIKVVFVNDPSSIYMGLPMVPFVNDGDIVSKCMLKAIINTIGAATEFGRLLTKEMMAQIEVSND